MNLIPKCLYYYYGSLRLDIKVSEVKNDKLIWCLSPLKGREAEQMTVQGQRSANHLVPSQAVQLDDQRLYLYINPPFLFRLKACWSMGEKDGKRRIRKIWEWSRRMERDFLSVTRCWFFTTPPRRKLNIDQSCRPANNEGDKEEY